MSYELAFLGLFLSLLYVNLTGLYPGGMIVPSYLVLFMEQPERIAGTLLVALLTVLCFKLFSKYVILYGRRRFVFIVLLGFVWTIVWLRFFSQLFPLSLEFRVIGLVIPGLIANSFERQGIIVTTAALITVTIATFVLGRLVLTMV